MPALTSKERPVRRIDKRLVASAFLGFAWLQAGAAWAQPFAMPTRSTQPSAIPTRSAPPAALAAHGTRPPSAEHQDQWRRYIDRERRYRLPMPVFVKVIAPQGTRAVFFSSDGKPHALSAPVTVGLRSRHRFAFALENVSTLDPRRFYGTIEVLRAPSLPDNVKASDVPVPIRFSEQDADALVAQRMLTKIFVLEDPDKALGVGSAQDEPMVYEATAGTDPIRLAKTLGDITLVVRIGSRVPTADEVAETTAAFSLLLPRKLVVRNANGEKRVTGTTFVFAETGSTALVDAFAGDRSPPPLEALDPIRHSTGRHSSPRRAPAPACPEAPDVAPENALPGPGLAVPRGPGLRTQMPAPLVDDDEYVCDGGDARPKAGRDASGHLVNVDPTDTVAEYRIKDGSLKITESNRVCVYSPRYIEVREQSTAEGYSQRQLAGAVHRDDAMDTVAQITSDAARGASQGPRGVGMRMRASGLESEQWAGSFGEIRFLAAYDKRLGWAQTLGSAGTKHLDSHQRAELVRRAELAQKLSMVQFPQVMGMMEGVGEVTAQWRAQESVLYEPIPRKPGQLRIEKSASSAAAQIGGIVGFTIEYTNVGEEPVRNIAIVDSLSARLEYVAGSSQSSADAIFTTEENEVGSAKLRWEVKAPLPPGASATVFFKARLR